MKDGRQRNGGPRPGAGRPRSTLKITFDDQAAEQLANLEALAAQNGTSAATEAARILAVHSQMLHRIDAAIASLNAMSESERTAAEPYIARREASTDPAERSLLAQHIRDMHGRADAYSFAANLIHEATA